MAEIPNLAIPHLSISSQDSPLPYCSVRGRLNEMDEVNINQGSPDLPGLKFPEPNTVRISVSEVARLLSEAGLPRNKRTIRRYCERGDLECRKTENALHQPQYFIDPKSVEVYIAQQKSLMTASPDQSGLVRSATDEAGLEHQSESGDGQVELGAMSAGSVRSLPGPSFITAKTSRRKSRRRWRGAAW